MDPDPDLGDIVGATGGVSTKNEVEEIAGASGGTSMDIDTGDIAGATGGTSMNSDPRNVAGASGGMNNDHGEIVGASGGTNFDLGDVAGASGGTSMNVDFWDMPGASGGTSMNSDLGDIAGASSGTNFDFGDIAGASGATCMNFDFGDIAGASGGTSMNFDFGDIAGATGGMDYEDIPFLPELPPLAVELRDAFRSRSLPLLSQGRKRYSACSKLAEIPEGGCVADISMASPASSPTREDFMRLHDIVPHVIPAMGKAAANATATSTASNNVNHRVGAKDKVKSSKRLKSKTPSSKTQLSTSQAQQSPRTLQQNGTGGVGTIDRNPPPPVGRYSMVGGVATAHTMAKAAKPTLTKQEKAAEKKEQKEKRRKMKCSAFVKAPIPSTSTGITASTSTYDPDRKLRTDNPADREIIDRYNTIAEKNLEEAGSKFNQIRMQTTKSRKQLDGELKKLKGTLRNMENYSTEIAPLLEKHFGPDGTENLQAQASKRPKPSPAPTEDENELTNRAPVARSSTSRGGYGSAGGSDNAVMSGEWNTFPGQQGNNGEREPNTSSHSPDNTTGSGPPNNAPATRTPTSDDRRRPIERLAKKKKDKSNFKKVVLELIPGFRGSDTVDNLVQFVEGNTSGPPAAVTPNNVKKKPGKKERGGGGGKTKETLVKSASLDENHLNARKRSSSSSTERPSSSSLKEVEKKSEKAVSSHQIQISSSPSPVPPTNTSTSKPIASEDASVSVSTTSTKKANTALTKTNKPQQQQTPQPSKDNVTARREQLESKRPSQSHREDDSSAAERPFELVTKKKKQNKKTTTQREAESFSRRQTKETSRREQARSRRGMGMGGMMGGERRTSVCSAPESENSDQSDDDSVVSLPAGECTPREHIPKQCASSGGTPQTSYADIAKVPEPRKLVRGPPLPQPQPQPSLPVPVASSSSNTREVSEPTERDPKPQQQQQQPKGSREEVEKVETQSQQRPQPPPSPVVTPINSNNPWTKTAPPPTTAAKFTPLHASSPPPSPKANNNSDDTTLLVNGDSEQGDDHNEEEHRSRNSVSVSSSVGGNEAVVFCRGNVESDIPNHDVGVEFGFNVLENTTYLPWPPQAMEEVEEDFPPHPGPPPPPHTSVPIFPLRSVRPVDTLPPINPYPGSNIPPPPTIPYPYPHVLRPHVSQAHDEENEELYRNRSTPSPQAMAQLHNYIENAYLNAGKNNNNRYPLRGPTSLLGSYRGAPPPPPSQSSEPRERRPSHPPYVPSGGRDRGDRGDRRGGGSYRGRNGGDRNSQQLPGSTGQGQGQGQVLNIMTQQPQYSMPITLPSPTGGPQMQYGTPLPQQPMSVQSWNGMMAAAAAQHYHQAQLGQFPLPGRANQPIPPPLHHYMNAVGSLPSIVTLGPNGTPLYAYQHSSHIPVSVPSSSIPGGGGVGEDGNQQGQQQQHNIHVNMPHPISTTGANMTMTMSSLPMPLMMPHPHYVPMPMDVSGSGGGGAPIPYTTSSTVPPLSTPNTYGVSYGGSPSSSSVGGPPQPFIGQVEVGEEGMDMPQAAENQYLYYPPPNYEVPTPSVEVENWMNGYFLRTYEMEAAGKLTLHRIE